MLAPPGERDRSAARPEELVSEQNKRLVREITDVIQPIARDIATLDGSPAELRARIEEYQAAGVEHLVVSFEAEDLQTTLRDMQRFATEVCPAFGGSHQ